MGFKQKLGFYNHNNYPVQFTLRSGRSAPITLDPGQPIVDANGHLVPPGQEELEDEVRMGTIGYIFGDNPKHVEFLDFNLKADRRSKVTLAPPRQEDDPIVATSVRKPPLSHPPDVTVSATHAPTNTANLQQKESASAATTFKIGDDFEEWYEKAKESGEVAMVENSINYAGKRFANKKALAKFVTIYEK